MRKRDYEEGGIMTELKFHKCRVCGCLFYSYRKDTYCPKCVPKYRGGELAKKRVSELATKEEKRKAERERWHMRMANPAFREHERQRSLARARADKKYAIK